MLKKDIGIINKLIHGYLTDTTPIMSSADYAAMIERCWVKEDGKTPINSCVYDYLERMVLEKTTLPLITQLAIDNSLKGIDDVNMIFSKCVQLLSGLPGVAGYVVTTDGDLYVHGLANLLDDESFCDIDVFGKILKTLDDSSKLLKLIQADRSLKAFSIKFGEDLDPEFTNEAVMVSRFFYVESGKSSKSGYIGLISNKKADYELLLPYIEYLARCIQAKLPLKMEAPSKETFAQMTLPLENSKSKFPLFFWANKTKKQAPK